MTTSRKRDWVRASFRPMLVGAAGVALALWLLPPTSSRLGPSTIELSGRVGWGRTTLQVTPFGTLSARTHAAPLDVTAALKQVDIEELGDHITTPSGRLELQAQIDSQIPPLLLRTAVKEIAGAAVVGGLLAAAVFRRRLFSSVVAMGTGVIVMTSLLVLTTQTFDQERFQNAKFTGSLARARQLVEIVADSSKALDEARFRYTTAARRVSDLMTLLARPNINPATDTTAILHISDVHANPVGLEIAQELAQSSTSPR